MDWIPFLYKKVENTVIPTGCPTMRGTLRVSMVIVKKSLDGHREDEHRAVDNRWPQHRQHHRKEDSPRAGVDGASGPLQGSVGVAQRIGAEDVRDRGQRDRLDNSHAGQAVEIPRYEPEERPRRDAHESRWAVHRDHPNPRMSGEMKNGHCISTLMVLRPGVLVRMTMTANGTAITRVVTGWSPFARDRRFDVGTRAYPSPVTARTSWSGRADATMTNTALPLVGLVRTVRPGSAVEQLVLIGQPRPIRVPQKRWQSWLDDPVVVARFEAKRYKCAHGLCVGYGLAGCRQQVTDRSAPRAFQAQPGAAPSPHTSSPINWPMV